MSQDLFPSRVALIFGRDFILMTGESNHSFSVFQQIPTFYGVKSGLCGGQFMSENGLLMLPDTYVCSCATLSQLESDESWYCRPGICQSHQGRKNQLMG